MIRRTRIPRRPRVAFQGERGAYSEGAAHKLLGARLAVLPCPSFEAVFAAVERGKARYGLIPIENSLAGSIHRNYDLLLQHRLKIIGEVNHRIRHNLMALPGVRLADVRRVLSHPVALEQCRDFLRRRRWRTVIAHDTAGAARLIREQGDRQAAAIAGREAARQYSMRILAAGIEDNPANFTRFFALARDRRPLGRADKTSIVFALPDRPGILFKSLSVFALRDINLAKIESRPIHGSPWKYHFYVDINGSMQGGVCRNAISHLQEIASFLKVLGSYPGARS
ncbi:MAG: prephenate dehydratase [Gemmataceae bacterium]|nr:prephenate dehydratase [Gemmataceae bacterium]